MCFLSLVAASLLAAFVVRDLPNCREQARGYRCSSLSALGGDWLKIGGDIWQAMSLKEQSLNVEKETLHAATHEAQTAGGVIGGSSVVGLVTAFIIGRKGKQDKPAASPP